MLPFPASTFQVDLHVNQKASPKETPQEKMADVMAIAEVTKEETPGDPETDRTSMMWMYSMCMVMSEWVSELKAWLKDWGSSGGYYTNHPVI